MDAINQDILKQLQEYAQKYFAAIVEANSKDGECNLKPGKYSAKDLNNRYYNGPLGCYAIPLDEEYEGNITAAAGTFKCSFPYRCIFAILADWETMSHAGKQKAIFEIGEVEERTATVIFQGKTALGKYAETKVKMQRVCGNWWMPSKFKKSDHEVELFYELNGVIFIPGLRFTSDMILNHREEVEARCAQYDDAKMTEITISFLAKFAGSEHWEYFKEVADRAGIDMESEEAAATIEKAKEEKRQAEERAEAERQESIRRREERERERKEREEQEKCEAAEHLAKAKENFVSGKMISRNDFELIAESVGYEINIRTVGTLRKRVEWIEVETDGTPTVYGTKRRAGLEGTFAVIREVHAIVKAQIPESEEPIKHISEIMETCRTWDVETRDYTDEYKYYTWLANHIQEHKATNKNTTELILEEVRERISAAATLAAHGVPKCDIEGAVCAVVNRLAKMEDILQFYISTEPPQSPETPQTVECTADVSKPRETARKEPKRVIRNFRTTPPRTCKNFLIVQSVPRCPTAYHFADVGKMVYTPLDCSPPDRTPPIRGDCKPAILTKQTTRINKPQRLNLRL